MTWLFTAQIAALALAIGAGSYLYARTLAQSSDRRFGPSGETAAQPSHTLKRPTADRR